LFSRFPLAAGTKLFSGNKGIFKFFVSKFFVWFFVALKKSSCFLFQNPTSPFPITRRFNAGLERCGQMGFNPRPAIRRCYCPRAGLKPVWYPCPAPPDKSGGYRNRYFVPHPLFSQSRFRIVSYNPAFQRRAGALRPNGF
jgi:hypothetical protein